MNRVLLSNSTPNGLPCVIVPQDAVWSLVEYLASRGVRADYSYVDEGFRAIFHRVTAEAAQEVLDDWFTFQSADRQVPVDAESQARENAGI